jgi:NAD(P)-dependent dehydrogenase (short-subunit alcohol dehydrogenase family)
LINQLFSLKGKVAVVTGGTGVLGGAMARALAGAGAKVGILGRRAEVAAALAGEIERDGGEAMALQADVNIVADLERARSKLIETWGGLQILVNAAGGNIPGATIGPDASIFGLDIEAFKGAVDLNLTSTVQTTLVFGQAMADAGEGSIINISSASAFRPLTRVIAYGAAKAAVENVTRWLAVELPRRHGPGIRVNAIAPGFFIGDQNRALLLKEDGSLSDRGQTIINHTPLARFGEPDDLISTLIWLCSPGAAFVTGTVIPVDGGFMSFSGV